MINHDLKCIFIHCQKCAGESIEKALCGKADKGYGGDYFEGSPEKHKGINFYKKNYSNEFKTYFRFTVVRNPYDRFISWVKYRDLRWGLYNGEISHKCLLKEANLPIYKNNSYKKLLNLKMENKFFVNDLDFIAKFENLNEDFKYVSKKLSLKLKLPHVNKSSKEIIHYSKYYNEELIDKVSEIYKDDLKFFNYKFEDNI